MKKKLYQNKYFYLFCIALFILLFFLFYFSPPSADDLQFIVEPSDLSSLIDATVRRYQYLNGRVLGNMSIVYLLDHPIIDGITRSGILFGLCYFIYYMIVNLVKTKEKHSIVLFGIVFFLVLFLPKMLFREVYNWGSAFCNYVPPIFFFFLLLYYVRDVFALDREVDNKKTMNPFLFFIAIITQLFMENFTIYVVLIFILLNIYYYYCKKKISTTLIVILLGSVVGATIMFCAPIYYNLEYRGTYHGNRVTSLIELIERMKSNYYTMSIYTWHIQSFIMGIISVLSCYLFYKNKKEFLFIDYIIILSLLITPLYCYFLMNGFGKFYQLRWISILLDFFLIGMYYISLVYIWVKYMKNVYFRNLLLFSVISIFLVNAPMLIVLPLSPRCFYFSYIFMVFIVAILFMGLKIQFHWNTSFLIPIIVILSLISTVSYVYMMYENYRCEEKRTEIISKEMKRKKDKIMIPNYPYSDLIECFGRDGRMMYRYHYKKIGDIEFLYQ